MSPVANLEMVWRGEMSKFLLDETRLIDMEGAFRSGKTTAACWKVLNSCLAHPGIHWLICRYSDGDTQSTLKPIWRAILNEVGITPIWDAAAQCDTLPNGSKVYIYGLKAQDQVSRYAKLRGKTLAGVYVDQAEELPHDVFLELIGRLSQSGHPHQLILTPNPPDENHWLATEFPEDNRNVGRIYYSVSVYDNAHNLPPEAISGLEAAYPPASLKYRAAVLGKRALNVIGATVYADAFNRLRHVDELSLNPQLPLFESLDFGKHHPCVVWAQFTPFGGLRLLGGILGWHLYLEDFARIVQQYRAQWFPDALDVETCCDPAGSHDNSQGVRQNAVTLLREYGFSPRWKANANAPDVRLAMVERLAGYMRRRTAMQDEAFQVETRPSRWLRVGTDDVKPFPFVADALEAGYVWDDHLVSVGSKQIRKPKKDGLYEHGMNCCEYLELNFGGAQPTERQIERSMVARQRVALNIAQMDTDPFRWQKQQQATRGGYR